MTSNFTKDLEKFECDLRATKTGKPADDDVLKTLDRDDIALLIGQDIAKWSDVKTQKESLARLRSLADRIVDYAHLHYSVQMTVPTAKAKEWLEGSKPFILPGLPGSQ